MFWRTNVVARTDVLRHWLVTRSRSSATHPRASRNVVGRVLVPPALPSLLVLCAAIWGMLVDGNFMPVLAPTGDSTLIQATTAGNFALLGILFGPLAGAMGGLVRDGSSVVFSLINHPGIVTHPDFVPWLGKRAADVFEDVMLGWVPGLAVRRTRRLSVLALISAVSAWISLPFLVICNTLFSGDPGGIWAALTTAVGDWDEPVNPSLTVYALFTGFLVTLALVSLTTRRRSTLLLAVVFLSMALLMIIVTGAHA